MTNPILGVKENGDDSSQGPGRKCAWMGACVVMEAEAMAIDELSAYVFKGRNHPFAIAFSEWSGDCQGVKPLAERNRNTIRSKRCMTIVCGLSQIDSSQFGTRNTLSIAMLQLSQVTSTGQECGGRTKARVEYAHARPSSQLTGRLSEMGCTLHT